MLNHVCNFFETEQSIINSVLKNNVLYINSVLIAVIFKIILVNNRPNKAFIFLKLNVLSSLIYLMRCSIFSGWNDG